ncbi:predicted protein [Postia placenta Mad-698-R]|uniref:Uncharacterized protein n=1 Tax=Postia placenta MAD-698-R-SB12 TaxID=670580 RepID=A0A1X6N3M4_9APHY|nr:hypothetical protein POSPLADRAFT_1140274 [Postia placenta MAD-698-R-SB12]EED85839.1 predicted protein [Postia placenta Mad-698-R]OSX63214.1 hypothetical protein POSPLADRAFT_1140274 [Postia placenta MAD-698-R-SB12]
MTSIQPGAAESIQAIAGLGSSAPSVLVRIPATGPCADGSASWQIKYVLDAGARGVLVPLVCTAAQAASVVAAARFPQKRILLYPLEGVARCRIIHARAMRVEVNEVVGCPVAWGRVSACRGGGWWCNIIWGGGAIVSAGREAAGRLDVFEEERESVGVVEQYGVFIGSYDLSLAYGYPPPLPDPHPDVEVMIQDILRKARAEGKKSSVVFFLLMLCAFLQVFRCLGLRYRATGLEAQPASTGRIRHGYPQIYVTSDSGAMTQALAQSLAVAAGQAPSDKRFGY